jgi:hypothetical protein
MPWTLLTPDDGRPYLELTYSGRLTSTELYESYAAALGAAREHDVWNVLSDSTDLVGRVDVVDLFRLASDVEPLNRGRRIRHAGVVPRDPEAAQVARFSETALVNRQVEARNFADREAALAWLLADG